MFLYDDRLEPAIPKVRVRVTDKMRRLTFPSFDAFVDTGADRTCIPESIGARNPNVSYEYCRVKGEDHEMIRITTAVVELLDEDNQVLFSETYRDLRLPLYGETVGGSDLGYLGRDVLNTRSCRFSGPRLRWFIERDDQEANVV